MAKKYFAKLLNCHEQRKYEFAPRGEIGCFVAVEIYVEYSVFQAKIGCQHNN